MTNRLFYHILLGLISPVVSLYYGFQSRNNDFKRWVLIIFITFYGSTINLLDEHDGARHWQNVYDHYVGLSLVQFLEELWGILQLKSVPGVNDDVYIHVLSYFTGGVLGMPALFFVFVSFVYGYFFSGALFRLFSLTKPLNHKWLFYSFAVIFVLWIGIEGINSVRIWTGGWILFYGTLSYFVTKKKKYLWVMALPPLVHVGYLIMAIPAWLVVLFGARPKLYTVLFVISFFTSFLPQNAMLSQLEQTEVGEEKVYSYHSEDHFEVDRVMQSSRGKPWYFRLYRINLQDWAIVVVAGGLILFGVYLRQMTYLECSLFSVGLLFKVLSNSTWFLYALTNRSGTMAGLFILATVLLMWQRGYFQIATPTVKKLKVIFTIALLLLVAFLVYRLADLIYYISVFMLAAPFVPWIDDELNLSVREFISSITGM